MCEFKLSGRLSMSKVDCELGCEQRTKVIL